MNEAEGGGGAEESGEKNWFHHLAPNVELPSPKDRLIDMTMEG